MHVHYKHGKVPFILTLVTLLLTMAAATTPAQEEVTYRVAVDRVIDFITVRDDQGRPVDGLNTEDFLVRINGQPVDVLSVDTFHSATSTDARWLEIAELPSAEQVSAALERGIQPRHLILVFDVFNSSITANRAAKETARTLLTNLLPIDRVSVLRYNAGLSLLGDTLFMTAPEALGLIDRIDVLSLNPLHRPNLEEISEIISGKDGPAGRMKQLMYRDFLRSLAALAEQFAAVNAHKTFLIFSEGPQVFTRAGATDESRPLQQISDAVDSRMFSQNISAASLQQNQRADVRAAVSDLQQYMAGMDATLYFIRRGRLQPDWVLATDLDTGPMYYGGNLHYEDNGRIVELQTLVLANLLTDMHEARLTAMREIADLTGGTFWGAGISDEKLVELIIEESGSTCQLVFKAPENLQRDGFNRVEIRTKNPALRVTHSAGFFGPQTREFLASRSIISAEREQPEEAVLPLPAESSFFQIPGGEKSRLFYRVQIPREVFADQPPALEVSMQVNDAAGAVLENSSRVVTAEQAHHSLLTYNGFSPLSPEGSKILLIIRDLRSGRQYVTERRLSMRLEGREAAIMPSMPILYDSSDSTLLKAADCDEPDDLQIQGAIQQTDSITQAESYNMLLLICSAKGMFSDTNLPQVLVGARSIDGAVRHLILAENEQYSMMENGQFAVYRTVLPLGFLPMAEGVLEIVVSDPQSGQSSLVRQPFAIADFDAMVAERLQLSGKTLPLQ